MMDEERESLAPGWALARLDLVADINPPVNPSGLTGDSAVSFVPMSAVEEETGRLDPTTTRLYGDVIKGYTRFQEGDLLFAKITPCMENGKVAVARNLTNGVGCGSTEFHVVRPLADMDVRYLLFFLVQKRFRQDAEHKMTGSAGQKRVPVGILKAAELPIPPSAEQTRIADKIDELFSDLDEGERGLLTAQSQLKKYRQAVLKAAVTGEITQDWRQRHGRAGETGAELLKRILDIRRTTWEGNEQTKATASGKVLRGTNWKKKYKEPEEHGADNLSELPEGWVWASFDQISWNSSYGTSQKCDDKSVGVPVLRIPNIRSGVVNFLDDLKHCSAIDISDIDAVKSGDMLVIRTNGSKSLIGVGAVTLDIPPKPTYYASYLIRFRLVPIESLWKYINMYWQSYIVRMWVEDHAATSAGQYNISQSKLLRAPIAIPGQEEMLAAIDRVEEEMSKIDAMEAAIATELKRSARLRQSILKAAFSGKLVPQNPTDEPANVLLARLQEERPAAPTSQSRGRRAALLAANPVGESVPRLWGQSPKPKTDTESPQPARRRGRPRKTELLA